MPRPSRATLFPYTTLFRSVLPHARQVALDVARVAGGPVEGRREQPDEPVLPPHQVLVHVAHGGAAPLRSEEHTSELQSRPHLVCRLLLEKKNDRRVGLHTA